MADEIFIYCLRDPRDNAVRYIGKTARPLSLRLSQHCQPSQTRRASHRARWIGKLTAKGLRPTIELLKTVHSQNWQDRERHWIGYFRALGVELTNQTDGGEGWSKGLRFTEAHRQAISAALKGHPVSEKVRASALLLPHAGRKKITLSSTRQKELRQLYSTQSITLTSLANHYEVSIGVICRWLDELGVERRRNSKLSGSERATCSGCRTLKSLDSFRRCKASKSGFKQPCLACCRSYYHSVKSK